LTRTLSITPQRGLAINAADPKYVNGHDDVTAGGLIGRAAWIDKISHRLNHFGAALDPHAARRSEIAQSRARARRRRSRAVMIARG
jgi:hypothetical protein